MFGPVAAESRLLISLVGHSPHPLIFNQVILSRRRLRFKDLEHRKPEPDSPWCGCAILARGVVYEERRKRIDIERRRQARPRRRSTAGHTWHSAELRVMRAQGPFPRRRDGRGG